MVFSPSKTVKVTIGFLIPLLYRQLNICQAILTRFLENISQEGYFDTFWGFGGLDPEDEPEDGPPIGGACPVSLRGFYIPIRRAKAHSI